MWDALMNFLGRRPVPEHTPANPHQRHAVKLRRRGQARIQRDSEGRQIIRRRRTLPILRCALSRTKLKARRRAIRQLTAAGQGRVIEVGE